MKSIFAPAAVALSMTLLGATLAAAASPPAAVTDPAAAILTPIGDALNVVVQPLLIAPANAVTAIIVPPPPPAPPAPVHHHRHHRHAPA